MYIYKLTNLINALIAAQVWIRSIAFDAQSGIGNATVIKNGETTGWYIRFAVPFAAQRLETQIEEGFPNMISRALENEDVGLVVVEAHRASLDE